MIIKNSGSATADELVLDNVTENESIRKITTSYVTDLSRVDAENYGSDTDNYAFRSILTNITDSTKEYTAVPYVKYKDGTVEYGFAETRCLDDLVSE